MRFLVSLLAALLLIVVVLAGLHMARDVVARDVYRQRLHSLQAEYKELRGAYDAAVRRTAVTELRVESGRLYVVVMSAAGELKRIATPFDPKHEIHVDFVVVDNRLWVRRVYDSKTAAEDALIIDPSLAPVAWDADGRVYGLTIYRPLAEGRWLVNATANGALTLSRSSESDPAALVRAPQLRDFDAWDAEVQRELDGISIDEVVSALLK